MKKEWHKYLISLGLEEPIISRAKKLLEIYQEICNEDILDIFVTEYMDREGKRNYESMWFFTEKAMMEAREFVYEDDLDYTIYGNNIIYWRMKKENYDYKKCTTESRMSIEFSLKVRIIATLRASGNNCKKLKDIFKKHIACNVIM